MLVEARLPETSLSTTADPLMQNLLHHGRGAPFRILDPVEGETVEFGGLAVTPSPFRIVDAQGRPHDRRFAFGVPTESVHCVSAAGARPGVNSVTLADADAIVRLSRDRPTTSRG